MLTALAISGYRSLRSVVVGMRSLNLITGANGSGKSSLYRALRLLANVAQGDAVQSLAQEGGLPSTLWAGPEVISRAVKRGDYPVQGLRRTGPVSLRLGFASDTFGYAIDMGLPVPSGSMFGLDPEIKCEDVWHGPQLRPSAVLVERRGAVVRVRRDDGNWDIVEHNLCNFDSAMARLADPRSAPELLALRDSIRAWRFYDSFRTDAEAPVRAPQIGTRTPVLSNDGRDLAAAMQTIFEIGDAEGLSAAVDDAFPGCRVRVHNVEGRFVLKMEQQGLLRPLDAAELSDGTLRYLLWIAILLSPRPAPLTVLNEPETSLHPDLLASLARLILRAAEHTQVVVVSHDPDLVSELSKQPACHTIRIEKRHGETVTLETEHAGRVNWHWPAR